MNKKFNMIYWKSENTWMGKLIEHPEIIAEGETLEELENNLYDTYEAMLFEGVTGEHKIKETFF
ncbi:type II toxin-antitoxin system HicB family antitoxin [Desulfobacterales bacterium HSG16]|nr:type II toxin-antitoxin system HicB family antitoxin [Desulfobacterales bacterium HSG16]